MLTQFILIFILLLLVFVFVSIRIINSLKKQYYWFPILKATNFFILNKPSEAIDFLIPRLKKHRANLNTLWILGNLYREKGWIDQAIQCHQKLLESKNITKELKMEGLLSLGLDYHRAGMMERALAVFQELIALDSKYHEAYAYLEKLYEEVKDWQSAIDIQKNIVAHDPSPRQLITLSFLHNELGEELAANKKYLDAIAQFRESLYADKKTFYAYINMGKAFYNLQDYEQAVVVWEQMLEEDLPQAHLVFMNLLSLYEKLNLTYKKQALIDRIKNQYRKNRKALEFLMKYSVADSNYDEAIQYLIQALEINPYSPVLQWHMSNLLLHNSIKGSSINVLSSYLESIKEKYVEHNPHICVLCEYKSEEYLKRCPHCHEWNTLIPRY